MQFTKAHGCGNDFIILNLTSELEGELEGGLEGQLRYWSSRASELCERHFGVGADGLLLMTRSASLSMSPSTTPSTTPLSAPHNTGACASYVRMSVINADGSLSEMCGNGLRCVALVARRAGLLSEEGGVILTGAGALEVSFGEPPAWLSEGERERLRERGAWVGADLGSPSGLKVMELPLATREREELTERALTESALTAPLTSLSLGNPHAVCFEPSAFEDRRALATPWSAHFKEGVNLSFAKLTEANAIALHVHERGCGWTLACGTGACATTIAAVSRGLVEGSSPVRVSLPGGDLEVTYHPPSSKRPSLAGEPDSSPQEGWVEMWGPALISFEGWL